MSRVLRLYLRSLHLISRLIGGKEQEEGRAETVVLCLGSSKNAPIPLPIGADSAGQNIWQEAMNNEVHGQSI